MKTKVLSFFLVALLSVIGGHGCSRSGKAQELPKSVIILSENKTSDQVELFQVAIEDALTTLEPSDYLTLGEIKGNGVAKLYSNKVAESDIQDATQNLQPRQLVDERGLIDALGAISSQCRNSPKNPVRVIVITEGAANQSSLREMQAIVQKDLVPCSRLKIALVGLLPTLSDQTVSSLHSIRDRAKSGRKVEKSMSDSITAIHETLE